VEWYPGKFPDRIAKSDADVGAGGVISATLGSLNPASKLQATVCAGTSADACVRATPGASCVVTVSGATLPATGARCDTLYGTDAPGQDMAGVGSGGSGGQLAAKTSPDACCAACLALRSFLPYRDRCVAATYEDATGNCYAKTSANNTTPRAGWTTLVAKLE